MKYIYYARKATEKLGESGVSIKDQENLPNEYCKRKSSEDKKLRRIKNYERKSRFRIKIKGLFGLRA